MEQGVIRVVITVLDVVRHTAHFSGKSWFGQGSGILDGETWNGGNWLVFIGKGWLST